MVILRYFFDTGLEQDKCQRCPAGKERISRFFATNAPRYVANNTTKS
jgi:hypothetical protein